MDTQRLNRLHPRLTVRPLKRSVCLFNQRNKSCKSYTLRMKLSQSQHHAQKGFTLIEAMITIAIGAILLAAAAPTFRELIEKNAVASQKNNFIASVNLGRSEAMKRSTTVVMCRSSNAGTAASPTCDSAGSQWKNGWIVFLDRNGNDQLATADGDVLLRAEGAVSNSGDITQSASSKLVFRPSGLMSSGASTFVFDSKSAAAAQKRRVCVTLSGRTRAIENSTDTCE